MKEYYLQERRAELKRAHPEMGGLELGRKAFESYKKNFIKEPDAERI